MQTIYSSARDNGHGEKSETITRTSTDSVLEQHGLVTGQSKNWFQLCAFECQCVRECQYVLFFFCIALIILNIFTLKITKMATEILPISSDISTMTINFTIAKCIAECITIQCICCIFVCFHDFIFTITHMVFRVCISICLCVIVAENLLISLMDLSW